MTKIGEHMAAMFMSSTPAASDNTQVTVTPVGGGGQLTRLLLWDNQIARLWSDGTLQITGAGWPTATTASRLRDLLRVAHMGAQHVYRRDGAIYYGDQDITNTWAEVCR